MKMIILYFIMYFVRPSMRFHMYSIKLYKSDSELVDFARKFSKIIQVYWAKPKKKITNAYYFIKY